MNTDDAQKAIQPLSKSLAGFEAKRSESMISRVTYNKFSELFSAISKLSFTTELADEDFDETTLLAIEDLHDSVCSLNHELLSLVPAQELERAVKNGDT